MNGFLVAVPGATIGASNFFELAVATAIALYGPGSGAALATVVGCRYAARVPAQVLQKLMRHSNIAITMDYYANVDEAVEEAVLGSQRNISRNTPVGTAERSETPADVNPSQD